MDAKGYYDALGKAFQSDLVCQCCGARPYVLTNSAETICTFCEAYVNEGSGNAAKDSAEMWKELSGMQACIYVGKWAEGTEHADAIAASDKPHLLFGAAAFYNAFSDYVYHDVDYTIGGFMYQNSLKRSDQAQKNSNNAMALISKSKGLLFRALKHISDTTTNLDSQLMFTAFMSNIKLGRMPQASKMLTLINNSQCQPAIRSYANMVYTVMLGQKHVEKYTDACFEMGIANSVYYLARMLAYERQLDSAIRVAERFNSAIGMPSALYFSNWLKEVKDASGL